MRTALFWLIVLAALAWVGFMAQQGLASWPRLSLDSGTDAATRGALRNAETWHVVRYAAVALVPAALALWLARKVG